MRLKIDNLWIGLLIGALAPVLTFYLIYILGFPSLGITLSEFIALSELLTRVLSLAIIPNVAIFFLFIWINKLSSARGVLVATMFYAAVVFAVKIFG
jgi:hypothetical protein